MSSEMKMPARSGDLAAVVPRNALIIAALTPDRKEATPVAAMDGVVHRSRYPELEVAFAPRLLRPAAALKYADQSTDSDALKHIVVSVDAI